MFTDEVKMDTSNDNFSFLNKFNSNYNSNYNYNSNSNSIPIFLKNSVWDTYIGKEIGEYCCLLCNINIILQRDFECTFGIPLTKGGSRTLNNILPTCKECNIKKGYRNIDEYLKSINKQRLLVLPEKLKLISENCILDPEIIKKKDVGPGISY